MLRCPESVEVKSEAGGKSGAKVKSEPKTRGELDESGAVKSEPKVKSESEVKERREAKVKPEPGAGASAQAPTRRRLRGTTENKALLTPPWSARGGSAAAEVQQKSPASAAGGSCYFVFLRNRDNTFDAFPLHAWFSFTQLLNYRHYTPFALLCIMFCNELPIERSWTLFVFKM